MTAARREAPCRWLALAVGLWLVAPRAGAQEPEEPVLGSASDLRITSQERRTVLIEAGTRLRSEPSPHARSVAVIDLELELEPLDRRGEWVKLRFGEWLGWAYLADPSSPLEAGPPPIDAALPPAASEPPRRLIADADRLAQALESLEEPTEPTRVGPFDFYSDVRERRKIEAALKAAENLSGAYLRRYALAPSANADFAVVLYDKEPAYREFEAAVGELSDLEARGHASRGIAALFVGRRTRDQVTSLLVHELSHLLNRTVFGSTPPPWLEEGIANDLAFCHVDRHGQLELGTLGGKALVVTPAGPTNVFGFSRSRSTLQMQGPMASLNLLQKRIAGGDALPLPELLDLGWREFVDPDDRDLRYVQSAFLIRYLLDELDSAGFLRFLRRAAAGEPTDAESFRAALDLGWDELTEGYERWLLAHTGRH